MKCNFIQIIIVLILMLSIGCEKNVLEQLHDEQVNWREWTYPVVDLPENLEEILIYQPCWVGDARIGYVVNGKVIIKEESSIVDGGNVCSTFKFNKADCDYYYMTPLSYPAKSSYQKITWSEANFLGFSNGELGFVRGNEKIEEGATVIIYVLKAGTQKILDDMISKLAK